MSVIKQPFLEQTASNLVDKDIIEQKMSPTDKPCRPDNAELKRAIEAFYLRQAILSHMRSLP